MSPSLRVVWNREAEIWASLQPVYPQNLRVNEIGIWWDVPLMRDKTSYTTKVIEWRDVQCEIVDAETDDGR